MNDIPIIATANEFADWLATNPPRGSRCQYYRGVLASDREKRFFNPEIDVLASVVMTQYVAGRVTLVQKRLGTNDYLYYAEALT